MMTHDAIMRELTENLAKCSKMVCLLFILLISEKVWLEDDNQAALDFR